MIATSWVSLLAFKMSSLSEREYVASFKIRHDTWVDGAQGTQQDIIFLFRSAHFLFVSQTILL